MRVEHFERQMDRLRDCFGDKAYPADRVRLIWAEVQALREEAFTGIVNELVGCSRYAPLLTDFRVKIAEEREKNWRERKKEPHEKLEWGNDPDCPYCYDLGIYLARKKSEDGVFTFRCHCTKGVNDHRRKVPHYTQSHKEEGFYYAEILPSRPPE